MSKKKKISIIVAVVLVLFAGGYIYTSSSKQEGPKYEYYTITRGTVNQEVSVTGKVKPAEAIDFAFEASGMVADVNVKIGDQVKSGTVLANIKNNDVSAQVAQASAGVESARSVIAQYQAQLDAQRAKLAELKNGARPEDIQAAQIAIDSAKQNITDAETNLKNVQNKAQSDLVQLYNDCANSSVSAVNIAVNSISVLTDIQYAHFMTSDNDSNNIADAKSKAVSSLLGSTVDTGRWNFWSIYALSGGAKMSANTAQTDPSEVNTIKALNEVYTALSKTKYALDIVPINSSLTASEKSSLSLERSNINTQLSTISAKIKSIDTQKNVNQSLATAAQSQLNQAKNALNSAEQTMAIKKAGNSAETIAAQEAAIKQIEASISTQNAQIRSAQASLAAISAQLSKTVLTSTIDGTVTKVDVKAGEMASISKPVISVMTNAKYKMEANIPEADIAKVKTENTAKVTLDAYGADINFDAKVVKIDPAETVVDGVSTYKVTFEFINEDEKIKSGMTANITINTAKQDGVLNIPQRALLKKSDGSYVLIDDGKGGQKEVKVETGLAGSDGNVEIISGISENEKIINFSATAVKK